MVDPIKPPPLIPPVTPVIPPPPYTPPPTPQPLPPPVDVFEKAVKPLFKMALAGGKAFLRLLR